MSLAVSGKTMIVSLNFGLIDAVIVTSAIFVVAS